MYYVYVLQNKEKEFYYGYTKDLKKRFAEHNKKEKKNLIYYEAYLSQKDALEREKRLKDYGQARTRLKIRLRNFLQSDESCVLGK